MRASSHAARIAGPCTLAGTFLGALFTGDSQLAAVLLGISGVAWIVCCRTRPIGGRPHALFWGVALGLRIAALCWAPVFSDDIQRYAWEGEVLLDGKSPYALAPDSPELHELRARLPELAGHVGHADVPAVYPPIAQLCGWLTSLVVRACAAHPGRSNLAILRSLYLLADLGVLLVIVRACKRGALDASAPLVWGWCPLVCLEFAGSGHLDSLGILFLLLALLAADAGRWSASIWCGLGAGVKFLPLCVLPWIGRTLPPSRRLLLLALPPALLALGYLPFLFLGGGRRGLGLGLHEYAERWESASLLYRWFEHWIREHFHRGAPAEESRHLARVLVLYAWLALALYSIVRRRDAWSGAGAIVGAALVLSPTLHPWYVLWLLPFLARRPSLAWSWLVASAALFYWPLGGWHARQEWIEPAWIWWAIAPLFAALWIVERARSARVRSLPT